MGLTFYQTLEFDISSNYRGKASVQCFIGVSNHTHLTKLAYPDWLVNHELLISLRSRRSMYERLLPRVPIDFEYRLVSWLKLLYVRF